MTRGKFVLRTTLAAGAAGTLAMLVVAPAHATNTNPGGGALTLAVYGDAPYAVPGDSNPNREFQATPAFIDSVNADPDVDEVAHVGDIHSGKQVCSEAYDQSVFDLWTRYQDPLIYTPGDNEWTDCQKSAEGGGDPLDNLALVRNIFFAQPGRTMGQQSMPVTSQAQVSDPENPTDANYVENVMWERRGIVFVTLNIPGGSNDDTDAWHGTMTTRQSDERTQRDGADLRWLDRAFATAQSDDARSVVVIEQADMWDPDGKFTNGTPNHIDQYEPFIQSLATHTQSFGKPVLLFDGDSHLYRSDNPLVDNAPCTVENGSAVQPCQGASNLVTKDANNNVLGNYYDAYDSHPYYDQLALENFHRITVHGSTFPLEWLKLTIGSNGHLPTGATSFGPFSWQRMPQS